MRPRPSRSSPVPISALSHVGHQDGTEDLVMEYLEGETLAARLAKGAQGAPGGDRALGLEARQGHADKMGVKLLDFGLRGWTLPAGDSRLNVFVDSDGEQALD